MKKTIKILSTLSLLLITGSTALNAKVITNNYQGSGLLTKMNHEKEHQKDEAEKREVAVAGEPFFRSDKDLVSVNFLNLDGTPVHLKVLDQKNRVLFREVIKGEHVVGKRFDFSQADDGVYTIVVRDGERKFYNKVEKF